MSGMPRLELFAFRLHAAIVTHARDAANGLGGTNCRQRPRHKFDVA